MSSCDAACGVSSYVMQHPRASNICSAGVRRRSFQAGAARRGAAEGVGGVPR
jgi:hypothetical protein